MVLCNGKLLDCSQGQTVQANPDISGLGVRNEPINAALISFMATSVITSAAIFVAYIFDALPEEDESSLVNSFDRAIITWTRKKFGLSETLPPYQKQARASLLERFVLVLSDQQLVTGIAVIASGYINACSISAYHFLTIVCLTWFSATTHLSTLTILRNYFKDFHLIRYTRISAMIALCGMLFRGVILLYSDRGDCTMPIQCLIGQKVLIHKTVAIKFCCIVFQLSFIIIAYSTKMTKLFLATNSRFSVRAVLGRLLGGKNANIKSRRAQYVNYLRNFSKTRSKRALVKAGFAICSFIFMECLDSFLWQLIWLFFMNFYGIRQVFWARLWLKTSLGEHLQGDENQWSFGQMVPVMLLVLPALTLIEGYEESRKASMVAASAASQIEKWKWPKKSSEAPPDNGDATPEATSTTKSLGNDEENSIHRTRTVSFPPETYREKDQAYVGFRVLRPSVSIGTTKDIEISEHQSWSEFWKECQDAYPSAVSWRAIGIFFVTALLLYAITALICLAWFMAGQYDPFEFRGIKAGITLVCVLMVGAFCPYLMECMRLAGY